MCREDNARCSRCSCFPPPLPVPGSYDRSALLLSGFLCGSDCLLAVGWGGLRDSRLRRFCGPPRHCPSGFLSGGDPNLPRFVNVRLDVLSAAGALAFPSHCRRLSSVRVACWSAASLACSVSKERACFSWQIFWLIPSRILLVRIFPLLQITL